MRLLGVRPLGMLLAAALLAGAGPVPSFPPGNVIRVKGISGDTVLQLVPTPGGGLVRADVLVRLLGGTFDSVGVGQWRVGLYGATLELTDGIPFASYNGYALPLAEETRVIEGQPHVSLQLFSEIIPRFGIGILWDRARWEVRLFQAIARRSSPTPPKDVPAREPSPVSSVANATPPPSRVSPPAGAARPAGLSRRYTVVVDAGHGGVDPGMRGAVVDGRTVYEAHITLAVSLRLEKLLKAKGIDVVMTRRSDTLIALYDRGPIANAAKGDLFISVHVNAANPNWRNASGARGFETFFLSTARTEDERRVAAMENDVVRFETTADPSKGDPLSFILNDLARNEHLRESSDLAALIQTSIARMHPGPDRGVKQAGLAVLATAYMPAVLVEIGFGSNPAEARWMLGASAQQQTADAIADAAMEYLLHYERRTRSQQP